MLGFLVSARTAGWRLKNRLNDEAGQTSSEYLVIAGMVVLIIIAILGVFHSQVADAMNTLTGNITGAVNGTK